MKRLLTTKTKLMATETDLTVSFIKNQLKFVYVSFINLRRLLLNKVIFYWLRISKAVLPNPCTMAHLCREHGKSEP